jgi:hypothetical protein
LQLTNHANLSSDRLAQVEGELAGHNLLLDVLRWAQEQPAGTFQPRIITDIVVQDEYTHDVIVPWRDGLVLVYDTN